jgi:transcriptional regulator with XRE-family HTH domain
VKNPVGLQVFANRLRSLRQARGYSQQKLADIANVEQSTIKRIELRQLAPTLDLLISLSRALALDVRDLVDDPAITHSDPEVSPAVVSSPAYPSIGQAGGKMPQHPGPGDEAVTKG